MSMNVMSVSVTSNCSTFVSIINIVISVFPLMLDVSNVNNNQSDWVRLHRVYGILSEVKFLIMLKLYVIVLSLLPCKCKMTPVGVKQVEKWMD